MCAAFNPYTDWLNLPAGAGPPNYYDLLGLALFEANQDRIKERYFERYGIVRQYEVGHYSDDAQPLLEELSKAFHCLTTPEAKRAYDEQLRQEKGLETTVADAALTDTQSDADCVAVVGAVVDVADVAADPGPTPEAAPSSQRGAARSGKSKADPRQDERSQPTQRAQRETSLPRALPLDNAVSDPAAESASPQSDVAPQLPERWWSKRPGAALAAAALACLLLLSAAGLFFWVGSGEEAALATSGDRGPNAPGSAGQEHESASTHAPPDPLTATPAIVAPATRQWTGMLTKVLAVRAADQPGVELAAAVDTVHLLIAVTDAKGASSMIDAVAQDLAFLDEIADYTTLEEGSTAADQVTISGTDTGQTLNDARVFSSGAPPVIALSSIAKADGSSSAVFGQQRDALTFGPTLEARELATALRILGNQVQFDAVVGDEQILDALPLRLDQVNRRVALALKNVSTLSAGQLPRPGQRITVDARITGDTTQVQTLDGAIEIVALLVGAGFAPASNAPAMSDANPTPSETPAPDDPHPPLYTVAAHQGAPLAISWSPQDSLLATSASDGSVTLWNAATGARHADLAGSPLAGPARSGPVRELHWSPDAQWLLARDTSQVGAVWQVVTRSPAAISKNLQATRAPAAWSTAGNLLAFSPGNYVVLAQPTGGANPYAVGAVSSITAIGFSPDGALLALGFNNHAARSLRHGVLLQPLLGLMAGAANMPVAGAAIPVETSGPVRAVFWRWDAATDTARFAARLDDQLVIYRLDPQGVPSLNIAVRLAHAWRGADPLVSWSRDGQRVASLANGRLSIYDLADSRYLPAPPEDTQGAPSSLAFAPDGVHLAVGAANGGVSLWNCDEQTETLAIQTANPAVHLEWRSDAQRLAALLQDGVLQVWDTSVVPPVNTPPPAAPNFAAFASGLPAQAFQQALAQFAAQGAPFPQPGDAAEGALDAAALQPAEMPAEDDIDGRLNLLRSYAENGAWEEYHAEFAALRELSLNARDSSKLRGITSDVGKHAANMYKQAISIRGNVGYYQYLMKQVVAIDADSRIGKQAGQLLQASIQRYGERPFNPNNPLGRNAGGFF